MALSISMRKMKGLHQEESKDEKLLFVCDEEGTSVGLVKVEN